jgi:UDP-4-amino-4,6-dideoxy-N-acetyl-beta-L-altrosamine transaminase
LIPYGKQQISPEDIRAVTAALKALRITQGPLVDRFEEKLAAYCGVKHAVAVSSGTAALHLACLAAGLAEGDEVITSPISFLATANAILYTGAIPVFVDIDGQTGNISPASIEKAVGPRTKAILVVHMGGCPADMLEIARLAKKHSLVVIEDACHALGAQYRGSKIGACEYSDMAVFSFHPVKLITTGEGGCITTRSNKQALQLKALRSHGVYRSDNLSLEHGGWYYEMRELGFNYRLTDLQCALGISQLKKAEKFIRQRTDIAERYNRAFSLLGGRVHVPGVSKLHKHAWHLYVLRLLSRHPAFGRKKLYDFLRSRQIYAQVHYIPIYRQPYYQRCFKVKASHYPNAESFYGQAISLPIFPGLSLRESDKVIRVVREFFSRRTR